MRKFKKVYLEITSVCNLACSFCPPTERKAGFMKTDDFRKRLEQVRPFTDYIYLHVKGEPLLHPRLEELLDASAEYGLKVNLTTNGTLIGKNRSKLLGHPALRQINFSLHSFDGHAGSQNKAEYVGRIVSFVKEAVSSSPLLVSFRLWNLTPDNMTNVQRQRNRDILSILEREFALETTIDELAVRGGGIKLAEQVYLHQDHEFAWPDLQAPEDDGKGFCFALRNQAAILVDGTVVPCCLDGEGIINLGNINDKPLEDILQDERARRLYDGFSRRVAVEELCRKCGYRQRFGS